MKQNNIVTDYKIVRGHPADVEAQVQRLLKKNYQPRINATRTIV